MIIDRRINRTITSLIARQLSLAVRKLETLASAENNGMYYNLPISIVNSGKIAAIGGVRAFFAQDRKGGG
jgi:hypothetical protein